MFRSTRIQNHLEDQKLNVVRQYDAEQLFGFRLKNITEHRIEILLRLICNWAFRQIKAADRQQGLYNRTLADCIDEMREEHGNFVHFASKKFFYAEFGEGLAFHKAWGILELEI